MKNRLPTRSVALCGMLLSAMLVLGFVESRLPSFSVPGIKLGLSNSVLLFALYSLGIPAATVLMLLKVVLSGALFGGVSAMMYALAGGVLSMACMAPLSRVKGVHILTVSMVGASAHNTGQILLAMLVMNTPKLAYYMGVLLIAGLACGLLTGLCAQRVIKRFGK